MILKLLKLATIFIAIRTSDLNLIKDDYNWDPQNRIAPPLESSINHNDYIITGQRLNEIRKQFFYWYFDKDTFGGSGDLQKNIRTQTPQIEKNFNFPIRFFGNQFNYTRISINGYLEFSDPPEHYTYPLHFPIKNWPKENDPSFIGIFFSKCRIGLPIGTESDDERSNGVYFRLESNLKNRADRFGVEVRERVMWDIREGIIGANSFIPNHVIIVTWKNMTFLGGIDKSRATTNTFQMVIATDEILTYAIYNYDKIVWTTHSEAGGDVEIGLGGIPAFIGFNAGNGSQAYEYFPYSQSSSQLNGLTTKGHTNNFPGRHIFRIDENIMLGTCMRDYIDSSRLQFIFAPESGNVLGGQIVNITGPCFDPSKTVVCHFDTEDVVGIVLNMHRAYCIQPTLKTKGHIPIPFEISVQNERFKSNQKYFVF